VLQSPPLFGKILVKGGDYAVYCQKCGTEINGGAKFCPECGNPVDAHDALPNASQTQSMNIRPKKRRKGCIFAFLIVAVLGTLVAVVSSQITANSQGAPISPLESSYENTEPVVDILQEVTQADPLELAHIRNVLAQCGVTVTDIQHDESLDGYIENDAVVDVTGYRIESSEVKNIILYLNRDMSVFAVRYADENMFKDGNQLKTLTQIINRPDLELVGDVSNRNDGIALYLEGTIKNNTLSTYSYVQVTFGVYDDSGNRVDTALANINNLGAGESWKFEAISFSPPKNGGSFKLDEITGF
jgi:hypothetical protein